MRYLVRTFDAGTGQVEELDVPAASAAAARAQCTSGDRVVLAVKRLGRGQSPATWRVGAAFDVAWWCRELRTLLHAGMTVVEALETLQLQQPPGSARAQAQDALLRALQQGQSLSTAMAAQGGFPGVLVAGVRASERTSALVPALDDYLHYHDILLRLRKQVVSAALYPAVVVTLGGAITVFLLVYVMPRFAGLYADMRGPLSPATGWLMGTSRLLTEHGPLVMLALLAAGAAAFMAWRSGAGPRLLDRCCEAFGPLRRQIDHLRLAKLYQSIALMFRGGFTLDEALGHCASLRLGARLSRGVDTARQGLQRGERVAVAMERAGLTDPVSLRLLAVGERSGQFERILQTIAERHADSFTTFIERATRLVEPLMLLLVSLLVGAIVVLMYMPVFDIASGVRGG